MLTNNSLSNFMIHETDVKEIFWFEIKIGFTKIENKIWNRILNIEF